MAVIIDGSAGVTTNAGGAVNPSTDIGGINYSCRAWVNFDGTKDTTGAASTANTNRLIRGSGNVTSVLRNATGDYTITFTTAMTDANYAVVTCGNRSAAFFTTINDTRGAPTASLVYIATAVSAGTLADSPYANVSIFR